jgi:hypothetical protein
VGDPELWALMQRVETLRYRAELLESASMGLQGPARGFVLGIAVQLRQLAEQVYALSKGDDLEPVRPLGDAVNAAAQGAEQDSLAPEDAETTLPAVRDAATLQDRLFPRGSAPRRDLDPRAGRLVTAKPPKSAARTGPTVQSNLG